MFDTLTDRLDGTFKKLRSRGKLHPKQVDNALSDMRTALLEADVAVEVADDFLARVRERALSEEVMKSLTPGQQVIKVVNEELTVTLGGDHRPFELGGAQQGVVLMAGVQGSGKTTLLRAGLLAYPDTTRMVKVETDFELGMVGLGRRWTQEMQARLPVTSKWRGSTPPR